MYEIFDLILSFSNSDEIAMEIPYHYLLIKVDSQ